MLYNKLLHRQKLVSWNFMFCCNGPRQNCIFVGYKFSPSHLQITAQTVSTFSFINFKYSWPKESPPVVMVYPEVREIWEEGAKMPPTPNQVVPFKKTPSQARVNCWTLYRKKKVLVLEGEEETVPEKDTENEELKKEMEEERKRKKAEDEKKKADYFFAGNNPQ